MSKEVSKKCFTFFVVLSLISSLCTIFLLGKASLPDPYVKTNDYHVVRSKIKTFSRSVLYTMHNKFCILNVTRNSFKIFLVTHPLPEQETAEDISDTQRYINYVHEIVNDHYPQLDPDYVIAIAHHESRFDPLKVNKRTGVIGLMQVSPKWHTERARNLGVMDLTDAYGNILVGCDILNELMQKEDFNYALNFFAGGYPYANRYRSKKSPFVKELEETIALAAQDENFYISGGE